MKISVEEEGQVVIIILSGDLDIETSPQFQKCYEELLVKGKQDYLIDLSSVAFIDSSGLGSLVNLFKKVRTGKGNVKLCALQPEVQKVFELTKLVKVLDIYEDRSRAIKSF